MDPVIPRVSINRLIEVVQNGGKIRTGVDIFNKQGRLILEKDVLVGDVKPLENVKRFGVEKIPIASAYSGGLWDKDGKQILLATEPPPSPKKEEAKKPVPVSEIDRKIQELIELKGIASKKYSKAKNCIKQVLVSIQDTGGEFDFEPIADTVTELFDFVAANDKAFSYLTKEIFSYDDYLYNHSINVCTIGTVIMKKFNESFSSMVNNHLNNTTINNINNGGDLSENSFVYYMPDELRDISIGFFMHDMGKVLIDKKILNKAGKLTEKEFEVVKTHSTEKGAELLEKNRLVNPYVKNISLFHHSRLFDDEERCYPEHKGPRELPPYVKVCKLADIYDAMTSKRSYKEALNPVGVVADIFHKYAEKDRLLQYILHSFVRAVGIYPPGSVVVLTNGQLAYILDSEGPTLLPVTDTHGQTMKGKPDMIVLSKESGLQIDRRKAPLSPLEAHKILPGYLIKSLLPDNAARTS